MEREKKNRKQTREQILLRLRQYFFSFQLKIFLFFSSFLSLISFSFCFFFPFKQSFLDRYKVIWSRFLIFCIFLETYRRVEHLTSGRNWAKNCWRQYDKFVIKKKKKQLLLDIIIKYNHIAVLGANQMSF